MGRVVSRSLFLLLSISIALSAGLFDFADIVFAEPAGKETGRNGALEGLSDLAPLLPEQRLFTLVYSSNAWGNYKPCQVCGGQRLGGLPKRGTIFAAMRAAYPQGLFFLAGANELTGPVVGAEPEGQKAGAISKAYDLLSYDFMALDLASVDWLKINGAAAPASAVLFGAEPSGQVLEVSGFRIGLVLLPVPQAEQAPWKAPLLPSLESLCASLRARSDLLVALSPWGELLEGEFLREAPPLFDLLLGGGEGFPGLKREIGRTLWLRPSAMGKIILLVNVMKLPSDGSSLAEMFETRIMTVAETWPENEALADLLK